jgi:mannan endo-1,4-beta-mannosidase
MLTARHFFQTTFFGRKSLLPILLTALMTSLLAGTLPVRGHGGKDFVAVHNGQFIRFGQPYRFIGANFWYGALLGSEGCGGDRARLRNELDSLHALGIDNLRILVGADGKENVDVKVRPSLQYAPGVYNDTILAGLDYLLSEMAKRRMVAVLYLNNSWEWSGGYGYYLEQAGESVSPLPSVDGYQTYVNHVSKFASNQKAHQLFYDHVRFIVGRTNRYTHRRYINDPAIMAWQIGNEPRAFSQAGKIPFEHWMREASALIKSLDHNHLVSTGSEGYNGCEQDIELFRRIHADPNIDYLCIHVWPYNWGWTSASTLSSNLSAACDSARAYVAMHTVVASQLHKPLVMEEFGYPRDSSSTDTKSSTVARDVFYRYMFNLIKDNAEQGGPLAGCNFWAWGGSARGFHRQWQPWDQYTGDPAQEPQGLNSVFLGDSTIGVLRDAVQGLGRN